MIKIQINYHGNQEIEKIEIGDWIDLRSAEDVFVGVGEYAMISLGVSMKLPEGYEAIVAPRSSTFKNYGIIMTNSIGVIDNSYCGDDDIWRFPAYCLQGKSIRNGVLGTYIRKGDRICQFRVQKIQEPIEFEDVEKLDGKNRGGFGTTGV